jgi:hypothetical protein
VRAAGALPSAITMSTRALTSLPVSALVALSLLVQAGHARACACCAEPGQRIEATAPLSSYERGELERLRFAKAAKLYVTAAGFDAVSGVSDPSERYEVGHTRQGGVWTFTFKNPKGNAGALSFTLPTNIEAFFVDPHDGNPSVPTDPLLYKEWRLAAPLTATGIFKPGAAGAPTVRLILHGRGNACTSAEQFSAWTLEVSGPRAHYTLFGALAAPAAP